MEEGRKAGHRCRRGIGSPGRRAELKKQGESRMSRERDRCQLTREKKKKKKIKKYLDQQLALIWREEGIH